MLEIKNLVKIYKPKKGVPVKALDGVSSKFADTGMVFLLGKSGSGKSTLLNLLGGLDRATGGEILINGVSAKKFRQKHFDSYRNTYVGFIFQEYNLLKDFSVGANVALAIELQGKKATNEAVNEILKEIDLEGYANRKINELSGGQKQRVAIARALVKNPQIIMADEPTGALDSVTGQQVFSTLKKLSKDKLVIVVSHDREFAEQYADRIIEFSDGKVINDIEVTNEEVSEDTKETLSYEGNVINIPFEYKITDEETKAISDYIKALKTDEAVIKVVKRKAVKKTGFRPTDASKITSAQTGFKLIKSKLPLKNAFKIGCSSLKYKKFKLIITIFLCCISFGLFGLADTFAAYNHVEVCTNSLVDSNVNYFSVSKSQKVKDGRYSYWNDYGFKIFEEDIDNIKENTGISLNGVYLDENNGQGFYNNLGTSYLSYEGIYIPEFNGFSEINKEILETNGFEILAGELPHGSKNEIAISEYIFKIFKEFGYNSETSVSENIEKISKYNDIIGKTLELGEKDYTVTAVIDTKFQLERYYSIEETDESATEADLLLRELLRREFDFARRNSYAGIAMVGEGFIERTFNSTKKVVDKGDMFLYSKDGTYSVNFDYLSSLDDVDQKIIWLDGNKKQLAYDEIIVSTSDIGMNIETDTPYHELDYVKIVKKCPLIEAEKYLYTDYNENNTQQLKVVGIIDDYHYDKEESRTVICSDKLIREMCNDGGYSFAIGNMPTEKQDIKNAVEYCYNHSDEVRYKLNNSVTYQLDTINEVLSEISIVFIFIGIGFALFAAIMLSNFIAVSISYKKQEIGILRAIGSRSNDVFKIFFAESFVIAMINFVLSAAGVGFVTAVINGVMRDKLGLLITILTFGLRQIILIFLISILVAFLASYLPVRKTASKSPVDAINNK